MAAAEARAGWQRTANRRFAEEDARRAPNMSCSPSSSSVKSHFEAGYIPHNCNRNLTSDTKWWLHLQPNFEHQGDFIYEQLNSLEAELEVMSAGCADQSAKISRNNESSADNSRKIDMKHNVDLFLDQPWKVSAACLKNEQDYRMPELKVALGNVPEKTAKHMDMGEFWYPDDNLIDLDPSNRSVSKQHGKLSSDWESQWIGAEKNEPWWRTADKDDLASLVAQKSHEHIENCDLPRPQTKHVRREPSASLECFGHDGILNSSSNRNPEMGASSLTNCMHGSPTSVSMNDKHCILGDIEGSPHDSDKPYSDNEYYIMNKADSENSPTKAQLLEALCHSQTRAREAEKAAQEAYTEKEHIIKLVFKQASQLFAYKQWFHLLQLENICLQLKNKNGPISTIFPVALPWVPYKGSQLKKGWHKGVKRKRNPPPPPPRYGFGKCAVAFAVGLSLAGAGLLLGWTMGWLFPVF